MFGLEWELFYRIIDRGKGMLFKRQKGNYHEVERVTRFKLIKSGKTWLRAAVSKLGLFKSVKSGDASSIEKQAVEIESSVSKQKSGVQFLRGLVATGSVLGGVIVTNHTVYAEEDRTVEKVVDTNGVLAVSYTHLTLPTIA